MKHAYVYDLPSSTRYLLIRGRVGTLLRSAGISAQWGAKARGWHVRKEHAADVRAVLEADGFTVHHVGGDPR